MKSFLYAHLERIDVKEGQILKKGDIIGLMGNTGVSNGAHVHGTAFEKALDYIPWMSENPTQKASKDLTWDFMKKPGFFLDAKTKKARGIVVTTKWLGYSNHYAYDIISGEDGLPLIAWNQEEEGRVAIVHDFGNLRFGKTVVVHFPVDAKKPVAPQTSKDEIKVDVKILPYREHYGSTRKEKITKIVIHHVAGVMTAKQLGDFFAGGSRRVSSNYGIGYDGSLGLYVPENMRAYTTADYVDEHAITVEVSNSKTGSPWLVSDKSLAKLIDLVEYICRKYGIKKCTYTGGKDGTLQKHMWYSAVDCPGSYLGGKFPYIADEVNKRLGATEKPTPKPTPSDELFRVQVGAFKTGSNAIATEKKLKAKGYDTYVIEDNGYIKVQTGAFAKKDNALALEKKLKADGFETYITTKGGKKYSPEPVKPTPPRKSISQLADEVMRGDWGNDPERSKALKKEGYDPVAVQREVDRKYYS